MLVGLVDELCAAAPTVIVLDDLQWADDASLIELRLLSAVRTLTLAPTSQLPG